jgi:hypothetical protein
MPLDKMVVSDVTTLINNTDELIAVLNGATANVTFGPFYNPKVALRLGVNISAITAGSLTVSILGYDQSSGATWTVLASTALAATGLTRLAVGPFVVAAANAIVQDYPPVFYQVQCVVVTGPVTATIGVHGIGA